MWGNVYYTSEEVRIPSCHRVRIVQEVAQILLLCQEQRDGGQDSASCLLHWSAFQGELDLQSEEEPRLGRAFRDSAQRTDPGRVTRGGLDGYLHQ